MLGKTFTCALITPCSAFNQSIQLDSVRTGKQILPEFLVPRWKWQHIPVGTRDQWPVSAVTGGKADWQLFLSMCSSTSNVCRPQSGTRMKHALMNFADTSLFPVIAKALLLCHSRSLSWRLLGRVRARQSLAESLLRFSWRFSSETFLVAKCNELPPHPHRLSSTANTNCKITGSDRGDLKEAEPRKSFVWERLSLPLSNWWLAKFILQYLQ